VNFNTNFSAISNVFFVLLAFAGLMVVLALSPVLAVGFPEPTLLTDPFLQLPTPKSVRVVWFSEFAGKKHWVEYGQVPGQQAREVVATTTKLSRVREDQNSKVGKQITKGQIYQGPIDRNIWRHEAEVTGLQGRIPYRVASQREDGKVLTSKLFTLAPSPPVGIPQKILLTSDHQLTSMTPANLQKVVETVGRVDAVFFAGDLVNIADRASEWFDTNVGNAFFPCLQGRANYQLERKGNKTLYRGGEIIQSAPLFPAVGNHEVMGRYSTSASLNEQFADAYPRSAAAKLYAAVAKKVNPAEDLATQQAWLKNNSFNIDTYEEIFTLPKDSPGGKKYYAITFGDVRLISLYATNVWRSPSLMPDSQGKYREREADFAKSSRWGYGQHIFEPIGVGSDQYQWLQAELDRPEWRRAKYKIVMFHHPPHSLGDNIVPAYTDPIQTIDRAANGQVKSVRYDYPIEDDYLIRDVVPLLESAGTQLVFYGHSHLWNRFISPARTNFLESSNVGNSYGAYLAGSVPSQQRPVPDNSLPETLRERQTYPAVGNPNGLTAVFPTLIPFKDEAGVDQPYLASNDITVFSILDTATGHVSSYSFDTRQPSAQVVLFDRFSLSS
jgi:Calcineurin-like phosphoesterase